MAVIRPERSVPDADNSNSEVVAPFPKHGEHAGKSLAKGALRTARVYELS
jgi:hypothetical protein